MITPRAVRAYLNLYNYNHMLYPRLYVSLIQSQLNKKEGKKVPNYSEFTNNIAVSNHSEYEI